MQGIFFMQLLLLAALLLLSSGGKRPQLTGEEMTEILNYISGGNGEIENIVKQVEQVSKIINTFAPLMGAVAGSAQTDAAVESGGDRPKGYCLQPISNIADDNIYNALSNAIG